MLWARECLRLGWLHPSGAASAADAGPRLVTLLAVGAVKWIGDRISERLRNSLSGGLFLVFDISFLKQALG